MKLGIFIIPKDKFLKTINYHKKKIKSIYGNNKYLSHPPHCTLYVFNIFKKNIKEIKKIKVIEYKQPIKFKINKLNVFKNDVLTGKDTIFFEVDKNRQILNFQKFIINNFSKNAVIKKNSFKFSDSIMKKNFNKYGYPFIGKNWRPHFTIVSIKEKKLEDQYFKNLLKKKFNFYSQISKIYIYEIIKDEHKLISSIKIIPTKCL